MEQTKEPLQDLSFGGLNKQTDPKTRILGDAWTPTKEVSKHLPKMGFSETANLTSQKQQINVKSLLGRTYSSPNGNVFWDVVMQKYMEP